VRADDTSFEHASIESAETPAGGGRIAGVDLRVVDGEFEGRVIYIEGCARRADFGELEEDFSGAIALAGAKLAAIQALGGEILAECSGVEGVALGDQLVDAFGGDYQHCLGRSAVNFWMGPGIALNSFGGDDGLGDGAFRNTAGRDVDLEYGSGHGRPKWASAMRIAGIGGWTEVAHLEFLCEVVSIFFNNCRRVGTLVPVRGRIAIENSLRYARVDRRGEIG
jgi:hypothetical protein